MRALRFLALGLLVSVTYLSAQSAHAGLLLEPYVGYKVGKLSYSGSQSGDLTLSAPTIGARVGVTFPLIFVALDYDTLPSGTFSSGTNGLQTGDATESQLFAEVGVSLPLIRGYVGYAPLNTLHYKPSGSDIKSDSGSAIKVGVGTTILPFIAINLEYMTSSYSTTDGGLSGTSSSSNFYSLNVSLPLNL